MMYFLCILRFSDIFVHRLILVSVFIPFGLHNFSFSFYSISEIILVLVFI